MSIVVYIIESTWFTATRRNMFLLVPAHPGCPGQNSKSRKTVVCVCVGLELLVELINAARSLICSASLSISIASGALMLLNIHVPHLSDRTCELWQMADWIRMPFGVVSGVGPGIHVLDGR